MKKEDEYERIEILKHFFESIYKNTAVLYIPYCETREEYINFLKEYIIRALMKNENYNYMFRIIEN
mgnify:FL=1